LLFRKSARNLGGMWQRLLRISPVVALIALLASCSETFPVEPLPPRLVLYEFGRAGVATATRIVDTEDPTYRNLKEIIARERDGWRWSFVTYVPGPFQFRSEDDRLTIDCKADRLVVIHSGGQLEKSIPGVLTQLGLAANRI
jgi:hypothetical protein